jgi:hypothetical protein
MIPRPKPELLLPAVAVPKETDIRKQTAKMVYFFITTPSSQTSVPEPDAHLAVAAKSSTD